MAVTILCYSPPDLQPKEETLIREFTLANARLIVDNAEVTGRLTVTDGVISSIDYDQTVPRTALDCGGDFLSPGMIELHTDNLERHLKPRPGVRQPTQDSLIAHDGELASTGITTVFDALRVGSVVSDGRNDYEPYALEAAEALVHLKEEKQLRIDHQIHLRAEICSETLAEELDAFGASLGIGIVSLMDHTPGQRQFRNIEQLTPYLKGKHGMSDADIEKHFVSMKELRERNGASHRNAAIRFAKANGAVLASHDDTTAADVAESKQADCALAEFPTTMEAAAECEKADIAVMMGAPNLMRGGSHSGNVSAADLVETGYLKILSSDYVPSTLLRAAVKLGGQLNDMASGIATVTAQPARIVGLNDRGRIAVGLRADLVRFGVEGIHPVIRGVWSAGRQVA